MINEEVIVRVERRKDLIVKIVWVQGCEAGGILLEPANLPNE